MCIHFKKDSYPESEVENDLCADISKDFWQMKKERDQLQVSQHFARNFLPLINVFSKARKKNGDGILYVDFGSHDISSLDYNGELEINDTPVDHVRYIPIDLLKAKQASMIEIFASVSGDDPTQIDYLEATIEFMEGIEEFASSEDDRCTYQSLEEDIALDCALKHFTEVKKQFSKNILPLVIVYETENFWKIDCIVIDKLQLRQFEKAAKVVGAKSTRLKNAAILTD